MGQAQGAGPTAGVTAQGRTHVALPVAAPATSKTIEMCTIVQSFAGRQGRQQARALNPHLQRRGQLQRHMRAAHQGNPRLAACPAADLPSLPPSMAAAQPCSSSGSRTHAVLGLDADTVNDIVLLGTLPPSPRHRRAAPQLHHSPPCRLTCTASSRGLATIHTDLRLPPRACRSMPVRAPPRQGQAARSWMGSACGYGVHAHRAQSSQPNPACCTMCRRHVPHPPRPPARCHLAVALPAGAGQGQGRAGRLGVARPG